jgi:ATP-dependent Clp protease ATP-binding subunit ClpA
VAGRPAGGGPPSFRSRGPAMFAWLKFGWLKDRGGVPVYSRFTDRARKVMQLANREAQRFNHEYIGTEHVLLGLIKEGSGVAATVLKNLGVDPRRVRLEVERIVQHGPGGEQVVTGRLPHTPRAKKVIEYAIEESRGLRHEYVGTEHLLLGLVREQEGVASQVLLNMGLSPDRVREEVLHLLGNTDPSRRPGPQPREAAPRPLSPAAELDAHLVWLGELMERFVADRDVERAAEVLDQIERVRAVRDRLA